MGLIPFILVGRSPRNGFFSVYRSHLYELLGYFDNIGGGFNSLAGDFVSAPNQLQNEGLVIGIFQRVMRFAAFVTLTRRLRR